MSKPLTDEEIFAAALRIQATPDRLTYLEHACAGNVEQLARVKALLAALDDAGSFLNKPVADFAALGATVTPDPNAANDLPPKPATDVSLDFLSPSDNPDALGKLGPYIVEDIIGRGGMGIVLRAVDPKLNRVVAIKVLAPELAKNPMAGKRFLREAQAAAAVSHDHVVRIYAVEDAAAVPYLVMECIVGQSLQQKIERKGILEIREILRIGNQMAAGLAAAHKQGLVHRDIKPANILLENGIERVKITDFGLARAVDDVGITQSGQVTGTPQYMSPEQAMGEQVDHRSDLFSLGSVLYTMCTGRPAFRATSTVAVLRRVVDDAPRPIRELNPEAPNWLIAIIDKLMAKKPEDRYQTAQEVAGVLEQWLAHYQRPQTVPAPVYAGPSDRTAIAGVAVKGTLRRAWDEWWSERDRWVAISVQTVLAVLHMICMLIFLNFVTSKTTVDGRPRFQFLMGAPYPWYRFEINHGDSHGFSSGFHPFTWSVFAGLVGWALYYVVWRIEKARDPKTSWWNRHEVLMSMWGIMAIAGVIIGTGMGYGVLAKEGLFAKPGTTKPQATVPTGTWQQLFNGRDQSGWITHPDQPTNAWHIVDGNLVGRGSTASHIFTQRDNYRDFHLRAEVKINAGGNSGIFLRTPFSMMERIAGSKNPHGYEVQISATADADPAKTYLSGGILPLANPSTNRVQPDKWFTLDVVAQRNRFVTAIDGVGVLDVTDPNQLFTSGHLALQTWGTETDVTFRKIEIRELSADEPTPLLTGPPQSPPGTIVLPDSNPLGKGKDFFNNLAATMKKVNGLTAFGQFDASKLKPTLPPWAGADASVKWEDGAWRIENKTSSGNFNVLMGTVLENIPEDGLIICRAQIKAEVGDPTTPGALQLGLAGGLLGGTVLGRYEYSWPDTEYEFRGNVSEWTQKEFRCPAAVFHAKNPPQLQVYVGLHNNGVVWVKDLELLHLPRASAPESKGTSSTANSDANANKPAPLALDPVLVELEKLVELAQKDVDVAKQRRAIEVGTTHEVMLAEQIWYEAKLQLAEAKGNSQEAATIAASLVKLAEENLVVAQARIKAGTASPDELRVAEKALSEAKLKLAKLSPAAASTLESPNPPSLPE